MKGYCFWVHSLYYSFDEIILYLSHVQVSIFEVLSDFCTYYILILIHYSMPKNAYDCFNSFLEQIAHHAYTHSAGNVLLSDLACCTDHTLCPTRSAMIVIVACPTYFANQLMPTTLLNKYKNHSNLNFNIS